jgi:hypothetical protein
MRAQLPTMPADDTGSSRSVLRSLDRLLGLTATGASLLVLPVSLLLFLQWPLRDLGIGYSREANDLAQTRLLRVAVVCQDRLRLRLRFAVGFGFAIAFAFISARCAAAGRRCGCDRRA